MRCPSCKEINKDRVIDSRLTDGGKAIRRRRECGACNRRYTTKERVEDEARLTVIKKNGTRMPFDPERILRGMQLACYKRPISREALQKITDDVTDELARNFDREVPANVIGQYVCKHLQELDHIAYVRFASVYREFEDLEEMAKEIEIVRDTTTTRAPGQQTLFD